MSKITLEEQAQLDAFFLKCHYDYQFFAATQQKIQTTENTLEPMKLWDEQLILEEIWLDIVKSGRLLRLWLLKSRRQGFSTWALSKSHWLITARGEFENTQEGLKFKGLRKNQIMSVIAHDPRTTSFLFDVFKRMNDSVQPELRQKTTKNNGYLIHFKDEDDPHGVVSLDSSVFMGSSDTADCGSGMGLTIVLCDELAKWPSENAKSLLTSLNNALSDSKNSVAFYISTAKGIGGEYYNGFNNCRYVYEVTQTKDQKPVWTMRINENSEAESQSSSVFVPWYTAKKYRMPVPSNFKRTEEEKRWQEKYNLSDEQIMWYRHCLVNRCAGDRAMRQQEYPFTAKEAFIGSGTPSFDLERLEHFRKLCEIPIARYDCLLSGGQFISAKQGLLRVWEEPRRGTAYLISADVSEGLEIGDFDSADVIDHLTGIQVAHFHGKMSPFEYAQFLYYLGMRYNGAWICPERNNHGLSVVQELIRLEYENIYVEVIVEPPNKPRKRFGWLTTEKSRALVLDNLKQVATGEDPGIRCAETYEEMMNFKRQKDGREEADAGTFDDRVLSISIGKHLIKTLPCVVVRRKIQGDGTGRGSKQKKPDNKAFM